MPLDATALDELRSRQCGVVARWQVVELEGSVNDFRRMVRRGAPLGAGVCVDHTGDPTWNQRAWAAVLGAWPAALSGSSALRAENGPGWRGHDDDAPVEVAVTSSGPWPVGPVSRCGGSLVSRARSGGTWVRPG